MHVQPIYCLVQLSNASALFHQIAEIQYVDVEKEPLLGLLGRHALAWLSVIHFR